MLFKRKGKIREIEDQRLISHIEALKDKLMIQTQLIKNSLDPSEEVIFKFKIIEAKYFFLLKEARMRNVSMGKSK